MINVKFDKSKVDLKKVERTFKRRSKKAMIEAVTWWHMRTVKLMPVSASKGKGQYAKRGRGTLRKSTIPFVITRGGHTVGGLIFNVHYAKYLIYGTENIAGGKVKRWKIGQAPITDWPAKRDGGNPRSEMPVGLSSITRARVKLLAALKRK